MAKTWQHYRARVASLSRSRPADDPELLEAEAQLRVIRTSEETEERTDDLIQLITHAFTVEPHLNGEQAERIIEAIRNAPRAT